MSEPVLEITKLGHSYGKAPVICDVSFSVAPRELVAILGASGCGKTTILRSVAGLVTPTTGSISIGGREVVRAGAELVSVEARRIGLVFQEYALFPYLNVARNVGFGLTNRDDARVTELLSTVGLSAFAERRPAELSGGQQQRVALARALAPEPHLLLLDEPFANVDANRKAEIGMELIRVLEDRSTSALMVTHDQADALAFAHKIAVLVPGDDGARLAQFGDPETVYRRPASQSVAELLGPANYLEASADGRDAECGLGRVALSNPASGAVRLLVRPEQPRFLPQEAGRSRVTRVRFAGRAYRIELETPAGALVAESATSYEIGACGDVTFSEPLFALPSSS